MKRVLVIGLDGFDPTLADEWRAQLPNLSKLMERGIHGPLQSIVQPVTPAAWTALISGRDQGHFGFTDFTSRVGHSYTDFKLVHAKMIKVPTLFQMLSDAGRNVWSIGVPISYPAVPIKNGGSVACFMAPSLSSGITYPPQLQEEILAQTSSPYVLDVSVTDDEQVDLDDLLHRIREMDRQRFDTTSYLMQNKPWDLMFMVAMGTDRVGHYFIQNQDPSHLRHDSNPKYRNAMLDHYRYCDERIGELIELAGPDTVVLAVSDHGMQRLDGKVNLNDWLQANGYLTLQENVSAPAPLSKAPVDWSRTKAWSRGYAGQIYLNVKGREQHGCVDPAEVDALLDEIVQKLETLTTPEGRPIQVRASRGRELFSGPYAATCPDLCVQFDDCRYLTSDQIGQKRLVTPITELGFDAGAHHPYGFFAMAGPGVAQLGRFAALHILDVAPTILELLDVPAPSDLEGRPIHMEDDVYSEEEEAELTSRLRALYLE